MHEAFAILLEFLLIFALVFANGFFVAAEFALVKVRASQLRPLAKTGGWRVKFALRATEHLDAALSATQLGITLASLGLGVLGELAPKSLAIQRPKAVSLNAAAPLMIFYWTFYPFIWLLNGTANRALRWMGLEPAGEGEHAFSSEELEYVFSQARHSHPGDALINRLMVRSVRLRAVTAQQIMRSREQVVALWTDKPFAENLRIAQTSGFSRFPVCEGTLDKVKGILLVREWLWQLQALGGEASFEGLIRPALTFTQKTPIHTMLELFRTSRSHLAVVIDGDEQLQGIVTFEDVLEEIVGDIRDEFDLGRGPVFEHTENAIVVSGMFTMRELQAESGWAFEWLPRESVAAWAERNRGQPLKRGESFTVGDFVVTPTDMAAERVRRVRVERPLVDTNKS